jgi:polyvinyl alcohol dehydrogenase (cytochrome)
MEVQMVNNRSEHFGGMLRGAVAAGAGTALALAAAIPASAVGPADWTAYLFGSAHSSYDAAQTAITPSDVGKLALKWHFVGNLPTSPGQPSAAFISSPIVADGAIFIGSNDGWFYKLDEVTGHVLAQVFIGYQPALTCPARGFTATATVAPDPSDGTDTVYVAAPDGYLYAFREADLSVKWRSVIALPSTTVNDYYDWSSPTVANGKIYVGISSACDVPLVPGGVAGYDQATGLQFARFFTMPQGIVGGSVWSSVAVDSSGFVYATTGNPQSGLSQPYFAESIVKLDGSTLQPLAAFTVPASQRTGDGDFGGSPTIFGSDVGACNKNGIYYVVQQATMSLVWQRRIGAKSTSSTPAQCSSEAIYDGSHLYIAGPATTIHGIAYRGSIRKVNPATGGFIWQTGLPGGVIGAPSMDGGGVIAVGTYDTKASQNAFYLVNAGTGAITRKLIVGYDFAQSAFADNRLFTAKGTGLYAWGS